MPDWRKAFLCASGECVEVAGPWAKSSHSNLNGNCVETATCACHHVLVRDSKDKRPDAPILEFSRETWREFTAAIKTGKFGMN